MRRILIYLFLTLFISQSVNAQSFGQGNSVVESLGEFVRAEISGNLDVKLIKVDSPSQLRISYNTITGTTAKIKFSINREGTLMVSESIDPKKEFRTEVVIYYTSLKGLSVTRCRTVCEGVLEGTTLDLNVSGGASLDATVDVKDLLMTSSGKSATKLLGKSKYMTVSISTAKFDGSGLETVSTAIDAQHGADARINVSERLDCVTSTQALVMYHGNPEIIRNRTTLFGGELQKF